MGIVSKAKQNQVLPALPLVHRAEEGGYEALEAEVHELHVEQRDAPQRRPTEEFESEPARGST